MSRLTLDSCTVDLRRRSVSRSDETVSLSETEAKLLAYLATHPGRDIPQGELLTEVWGYAADVQTHTVYVTVYNLRRKIEADPKNPVHLQNVRGVGYRFELGAGPVDATVRRRSNIAASGNRFVGRQAVLDEVQTVFEEGSRLVTLRGPGGVGKSRLARELSPVLAERFPGGQWLVDALAMPDGLALAVCLADTVGIPVLDATDREAILQRLEHGLAHREPLLVILDNAEHLVDATTATAAELLTRIEALSLLATSRQALRLPAERVVVVPPLSNDDAASLLQVRLEDTGASFALADDEARELVALLDGNALAIELSAPQCAAVGAAALIEHLRDHPLDLSEAGHGRPARHSTLYDLVGWSWQNLSQGERTALSRWAGFAAWFGLDGAAACVDGAMGTLQALVGKSLVEARPVAGSMRYRLPRLVRHYVATTSEHAPERARAWVLERAAELHAALDGGGDHDCLQALTELRADLVDMLAIDAHREESLQALHPLVDLQGATDLGDVVRSIDAHTPAARLTLALVHLRLGEPRHAEPLLTEVLADGDDEPAVCAFASAELATLACVRGDPDRALEIAAEQPTAPHRARAALLLVRANALRLSGAVDQAEAAFREVVGIHPLTDGIAQAGIALNRAAQRAWSDALDWAVRAAELFETQHQVRLHVMTMVNIGRFTGAVGQPQAAERILENAAHHAREIGYGGAEAYASCHLGLLHGAAGDLVGARRLLEAAADGARAWSNRSVEATALALLAVLHREQGREARAAELLEEARATSAADVASFEGGLALHLEGEHQGELSGDVELSLKRWHDRL